MQPGLDGALATASGGGDVADGQRRPGATSRWNAGKDLSWVPVRAERVVEVTFGQLENGRFRHGVSFVRWRPDRDPESCQYSQLDVALTRAVHRVHGPGGGLRRPRVVGTVVLVVVGGSVVVVGLSGGTDTSLGSAAEPSLLSTWNGLRTPLDGAVGERGLHLERPVAGHVEGHAAAVGRLGRAATRERDRLRDGVARGGRRRVEHDLQAGDAGRRGR